MRKMLLLVGMLLFVAGGWAFIECFVVSPRPANLLLWGALGAASTTLSLALLTAAVLMPPVAPLPPQKP